MSENNHCEMKKNKKVLLRERKRHTARRIESARFADGGRGVPHPVLDGGGGGYPIQSWMGGRVPHPVLDGGTPSSPGWYPPPLFRPGMGCPHPDQGQGTRPRPPPPPTSVDRLKILPSLILGMRAVKFF